MVTDGRTWRVDEAAYVYIFIWFILIMNPGTVYVVLLFDIDDQVFYYVQYPCEKNSRHILLNLSY